MHKKRLICRSWVGLNVDMKIMGKEERDRERDEWDKIKGKINNAKIIQIWRYTEAGGGGAGGREWVCQWLRS